MFHRVLASRPLRALATVATFTTVAACADASGSDGDDDDLAEGPGAFVADFATSEDFVTRMAAPVTGDSPHGRVQIWYSRNVESLLDLTTFTVPVGTVSIKTSLDDDGAILNHTVMVKEPAGFDPDNGDWRYEMRGPDGAIATDPDSGEPMNGAIAMCIGCHQAAAATDYLAGTGLR